MPILHSLAVSDRFGKICWLSTIYFFLTHKRTNYFFPHFIEQTIFFANFPNKLFFYEKTIPPPPPGIKWSAPYSISTKLQKRHVLIFLNTFSSKLNILSVVSSRCKLNISTSALNNYIKSLTQYIKL